MHPFFSFFSEKFWNFLQTIRWIFWALVSIAFGFFLLTAGLNISLQPLFPQNVCRSGTLHVVSQLGSGFKYFPVHFWGVHQLSSMFSLWQQKTSWFGAEMWSLQKYLHSGVPCTYVRLLFNFPVPVNFNWQVRWIRTCELRFYKMKLHSAWKKYTVSFFLMNFGMCWFISNVHLLNETWHLCSAAIQILIQNQHSIPRLN